MGEIWDVEVGHVTNRRNARLHFVVSGRWSYCPSGSGVIIDLRKVKVTDAPHVCKRCRKALQARLVAIRNIRSRRARPGYDLCGDPGNTAIVAACDSLLDGMATAAERVEDAAMLDGIRRNIAAAREAETEPTTIRTMTTSRESDQLTLF